MSLHIQKLRFRRFRRRLWRRAARSAVGAGEQVDKNFFGRLHRARLIWKFLAVWTVIFGLVAAALAYQFSQLKQYYQVLQPTPGGIYSEGIEGSFTTANPLYAVSDVDSSVSRLLFASLLTYDNHNRLSGDLADRWAANANGTVYTVHLRPNLTWQDGRPLTSDDVAFTYQTIQNPDAESPLLTSWQGVKIAIVNSRTLTFTLPNPLSSFPYSLTNGIVPKHILGQMSAGDLRSAAFNTANPIGAGPFAWGTIGVTGSSDNAEEQIILKPFKDYWAGAPKLESFSVHAYAQHAALLSSYRNKEVTAIAGLDQVPSDIARDKSSSIYNLPLAAGTFVFFKTTDPLLKDPTVRQALTMASDRRAIISRLGYQAQPVDEPLLKGQLGYDPLYAQPTGELAQAQQLLDGAGWKIGEGGIRSKNGVPLVFALSAIDNSEYGTVAHQLQQQWKMLGANVSVQMQPPDVFQSALVSHGYQAMLDGIAIGPDPDVFVYWDSTQADVRSANQLNFSLYSSAQADVGLEAGRTRLDSQLRAIKYKAFLQAWQHDNPALGLYQPRFLYIAHEPVYGLGSQQINADADRFNNVDNWMIHLGWVTN